MSYGRNKYQSRENRARVREILMRHWDPIGISDVEEAADEYDAYVGRAYVMLMDERANAEAIAAYLFEIATDNGAIERQIQSRRAECKCCDGFGCLAR
ncbi:MAG TPA: hypothetical protein VJ822_02825 [Dongiaceae bacterium]|nr:hypothetical protein [Dongiaceae bacterium]